MTFDRLSPQMTPPISKEKLPDLGSALISPARYYSRDWARAEWTHLWKKVWNLGVRESELPEPGDYVRHNIGKEDLIFMRNDAGEVQGFYNVCRHRGNQLCQGGRDGHLHQFHCPYHGWRWNRDGSLAHIADPHFFPQFRADGVPVEQLGMYPVKVEIWAGWVWFCLDHDAPPLSAYLQDVMPHISPYQMERWQIVDHKTFRWQCNWKHAVDAFSESYHFEALHGQLLAWANGYDIPIELMGLHSRMYNYVGTISPQIADRETISPALKVAMESYLGVPVPVNEYQGTPEEIYLEVRRRKRAIQHETYLPYADLTDEQLSEICHYGIFPNVIWALQPEGMVMFRPRPHETDPAQCYFDLILMAHLPPGAPPPVYEHEVLDEAASRHLQDHCNIHPINAQVVEQDAANLPHIQKGASSDVFEGAIYCDQEIRLRHFHQIVDKVLAAQGWAGVITAAAAPAPSET